ncbi:MAG TPA: hypothetical protein VF613_17815 [Longimicrobium sp.]|jgi:hypothetical protein
MALLHVPAASRVSHADPGAHPVRRPYLGGWRALGWFGLLITLVSLADIALTFYPARFGVPEWEFGTVANAYSGLPLLATGLAGVLAGAMGQRRRWMIRLTALVLVLAALAMVAATSIFLLDVPLALRLAPAEVLVGIKKTILKTLLLGTIFPIAFLVAAVAAVRSHPHRGDQR